MNAEQKLRAKLKNHHDIFNELSDLFHGKHELANQWLENPKAALSGRTPESFLESDPERIQTLLQRIKFGDFS